MIFETGEVLDNVVVGLTPVNVKGTNRELSAAVASFDAREMASTLSIKISASIVLLPSRGRALNKCHTLASADVMTITKWSI